MKNQFTPGDKALVVGKHPHSGALVTLLEYGPYGLSFLNLVGWKVRRTDTAEECYCKVADLAGLDDQPAAEPAGQLPVVEPPLELLAPTVSPGRQETTLDRLRAYYDQQENAPVVLTAHQQQVLLRLEAAWGLLLEFKSSEWALGKLLHRFKISRAQAYRDLKNCKLLFGDVVASSKEAKRYVLEEMAMKTFRLAKKAGELDQMNKAIANLVKITGIEHDDPSLPDPETFLPSTYVLELKTSAGKDLTLNLEAIAQLPAHQYEEVMEIIQNSGTTELEMMQKIREAARGIVE